MTYHYSPCFAAAYQSLQCTPLVQGAKQIYQLTYSAILQTISSRTSSAALVVSAGVHSLHVKHTCKKRQQTCEVLVSL